MEVILQKLIEQLNGAVFTLLAILILAFYAVYRLGGVVKSFGDFKEKNRELDTHVGGIKDALSEIKATTNLLYQAHLTTIKANSPVSLTSIGTNIAQDLHLTEKVGAHWQEIKTILETRDPSTPYDIQSASMEVARHCFDHLFTEEEKTQVKLYAYQKGKDLLEILPIIGILIRDRFLQEKGIKTSQ